MKQSIKQQVLIRIALIFLVVIVSGVLTISGMAKVRKYSESTERSTAIHSLVLTAEKAHYSWVENLCSAVSLGTEFTGSTDYKGCVLGKWMYGTDMALVEDANILRLVEEMKPIHQAIHESAEKILTTNATDPEQAHEMYLNDTKVNVNKLVAILDQVAAITEEQVAENQAGLGSWVTKTEYMSVFTIVVILVVSILLVMYVISKIVKPIEVITESSRSLSEGKLDFQIDIKSKDEIGVLADSLNKSVQNLKLYISDIASILQDMASGNLASTSFRRPLIPSAGSRATLCSRFMPLPARWIQGPIRWPQVLRVWHRDPRSRHRRWITFCT